MLHSRFRPLAAINLGFAGRQMYMHAFDLAKPSVPMGYGDYLDVITTLCNAAGAKEGTAYLTVDEKIVKAGMSQRRPKPHVDGCFMPNKPHRNGKTIGDWGGGGGGGWLHTCNDVKQGPVGRMSVIIAANAPGAKAWEGDFDAEPTEVGDLSHIEDSLGEGKILSPHMGYLLSPDCVHESMIMKKDTQRSFLRIALPLSYKF